MAQRKTPKRKSEGTVFAAFDIVSGKVKISDPCYDIDTWCSADVSNVKNGKWNSWVKTGEGGRCAELFAWHSDYKKDEVFGIITRIKKGGEEYDRIKGGMGQEVISHQIGVDSGQAGIFDYKFFKDDNVVKGLEKEGQSVCDDEPWYSYCSSKTLNEPSWGAIPYGVVSSSGWGDGAYTAYACLNDDGEAVGIRVVFL